MTRAAGLARIAAINGIQTEVLVNSPVSEFFLNELSLCDLFQQFLPKDLIRFSVLPSDLKIEVAKETALRWCQNPSFDVLVVDTFPRGIGGELATWLASESSLHRQGSRKLTKYLIARPVSEKYSSTEKYRRAIDCYDRVFVPADGQRVGDNIKKKIGKHVFTGHWVICDSTVLFTREESRRILEADNGKPSVAVLGTGKRTEIQEMERVFRQLVNCMGEHIEFRFFSPGREVNKRNLGSTKSSLWPLFRLYPGFDLVIGSGGYNTVAECRLSSTPLLAFPRPRMYDQQKNRLKPEEIVTSTSDIIEKLGDWRTEKLRLFINKPSCDFKSGTWSIVNEIQQDSS